MRTLDDTKGIFQQLADTDGAAGVQSIIENHDAWVHNAQVQIGITAAVRALTAGTARPEIVKRRIERQRLALGTLVTVLPKRLSSAG